jgi:hypothetical protein
MLESGLRTSAALSPQGGNKVDKCYLVESYSSLQLRYAEG